MSLGVVKDQAYFEQELHDLASIYEFVHGEARIGAQCDHDIEVHCPEGWPVLGPIRVDIDTDWVPEVRRLDPTLPVFRTMAYEAEMGTRGYIRLGRFDGLIDDPDGTVSCEGQAGVPGWGNFISVYLPDEMLEGYGIEHEGLRDAINRGVEDSTAPLNLDGGADQLDCDGPGD